VHNRNLPAGGATVDTAATHEGQESIRTEPFDAIEIELTLLWEEPATVDPSP
jgi:hypothetical protein